MMFKEIWLQTFSPAGALPPAMPTSAAATAPTVMAMWIHARYVRSNANTCGPHASSWVEFNTACSYCMCRTQPAWTCMSSEVHKLLLGGQAPPTRSAYGMHMCLQTMQHGPKCWVVTPRGGRPRSQRDCIHRAEPFSDAQQTQFFW